MMPTENLARTRRLQVRDHDDTACGRVSEPGWFECGSFLTQLSDTPRETYAAQQHFRSGLKANFRQSSPEIVPVFPSPGF